MSANSKWAFMEFECLETDGDDYPTIDAVTLTKPIEGSFGFSIVGGSDKPYLPRDPGIYISKIHENGIAKKDGNLAEGDKIFAVNGTNLGNITHKEAVNVLRNSEGPTTFFVIRGAENDYLKASNIRKLFPLTSTNSDDEEESQTDAENEISDPSSHTAASNDGKLPETVVQASPNRLMVFISIVGFLAVCMYAFKNMRCK
ncbi:Synaptojanin-2-binding protein [Trichuris trichiura]|uniref:Synaptojanin-2-binding protein n=1 Tax=Trichuris trichiura TaxID=36087 RepID=A0A077ZF54_TRITR|nr:Synaptojanin-2-binding protein [Trichuris trichiura]